MFEFNSYNFDPKTYRAVFNYTGADGTNFSEQIQFSPSNQQPNLDLIERAMFLSFVLIGTSYYKAHPTPNLKFDFPLDDFQAHFFDIVYQEGLSQFAFENQLTRAELAHFSPNTTASTKALDASSYEGFLSLQSGGKDSLLTATIFAHEHPTYLYISSSDTYPKILDELGGELQIIHRKIDKVALQKSGGLNGHVPITYIVQSLALIQAIINRQATVLTSIGQEGNEPHVYIEDLAVNHQWSKTWAAEKLFSEYVKRYISPDLHVGSALRGFSELKIAELFAKNCWEKYGHQFSSCNVANYRQGITNQNLSWCGNCAKCANSYLLFAPFIAREDLDSLYGGKSLFENPKLTDIFKGLLGVDGVMKPFECIGEVDELRQAYALKLPEYPDLPFPVPASSFDYEALGNMQPFFRQLAEKTGVYDEF